MTIISLIQTLYGTLLLIYDKAVTFLLDMYMKIHPIKGTEIHFSYELKEQYTLCFLLVPLGPWDPTSMLKQEFQEWNLCRLLLNNC